MNAYDKYCGEDLKQIEEQAKKILSVLDGETTERVLEIIEIAKMIIPKMSILKT